MEGMAVAFGRFAECFVEPLLLVTATGEVVAANAAIREVLGLGEAGYKGKFLADLATDPPGTVSAYLRACSRSLEPLPGALTFEAPGRGRLEYRCLGSGARKCDPADPTLVVLRLTSKEAYVGRFAWLNQQIDQLKTEVGRRRHAERQAERQRQLWQVTLSSIGDAVVATDTDGLVTFMNPVAEEHMGHPLADCLGRPLEHVLDIRNETTGEPVENPVTAVLRCGRPVPLANHTVLVRPNGEQLPIEDSAAPIRDRAGNLFGVVLVFHEVSETRRLHRELTRQSEVLREADRRKDEFLAVLAHELRNPLAPLRNGLNLLRREVEDTHRSTRALDMMDRQVVHLVRLVNDLMDLNRVTRGIIHLTMAPIFIRDVIARSVEAVGVELGARGHRLDVRYADGDLAVVGDADRLTQVFSNLLNNSVKYTDDGGRIAVDVHQSRGEVVVRITDSGIGIPPDQLERVFEMFSQVREHHVRAAGGLGIGLSVVRSLIQRHGGSIEVASEGRGRGSTFTVRLPLAKKTAVAGPPPGALQRQRGPLKILVADDNRDSADSLALMLQSAGHHVLAVLNGREAVEAASTFAPQLIFMDIGMPEMDGLEATQAIRAGRQGEDVYIVALTGWGQTRDRERTRAAGVDRHIIKPISPEELEDVIAIVWARAEAMAR